MKILIIPFLLICFTSFGQATIGIQYTTKGFGMDAGYMHRSGVQLLAGYNVSIKTTLVPNLTYVALGYKIGENITVTPSVGYSHYKVGKYLKEQYTESSSYKIIYNLEVGKDYEPGRVFITANYCGIFYAGVGMRAFIN